MKNLLSFIFIFTFYIGSCFSKEEAPELLYKKIFKSYTSISEHKILDTISENPINTTVLEFKDKNKKLLGFAREIITTTGCNTACLPIIATLFYSKERSLLALRSRDGLTKKYHAAFTEHDYQNLEMILLQNPPIFEKVIHPKQMVDAITGATITEFSAFVIKTAAYTTLRMNLYNQDTLKLLQGIK